jgi:hypothetical protein
MQKKSVCLLVLVTPATQRLRWEDCKFKASLGIFDADYISKFILLSTYSFLFFVVCLSLQSLLCIPPYKSCTVSLLFLDWLPLLLLNDNNID